MNRFDVRHGIDTSLNMGDVFILEATHHMSNGVHLADMRKELVTKSLAFRRSLHKAGDVHEAN